LAELHDISPQTRWIITTSVLTRLVLELGRGDITEGRSQSMERLFSLLGDEVKRIAKEYFLARDNAAHLVETLGAVSVIFFGREFETQYIEGFPKEGIIRLAECAMFREGGSPDIPPGEIHSVCLAYVRSAVSALNPGYSIEITMARCRGDPFCEMIIAPGKNHSGHQSNGT